MSPFEIVSIILNGVLGGGLLIQFMTTRSVKAKAKAEAELAEAEADASELSNADKAIRIYWDLAERLNTELQTQRAENVAVLKQIESLRREVTKLTAASNKILKLLDRITPENMESTIAQIKKELDEKNV